jgi:hypothetical protein
MLDIVGTREGKARAAAGNPKIEENGGSRLVSGLVSAWS